MSSWPGRRPPKRVKLGISLLALALPSVWARWRQPHLLIDLASIMKRLAPPWPGSGAVKRIAPRGFAFFAGRGGDPQFFVWLLYGDGGDAF
jgi:hypothetical protein